MSDERITNLEIKLSFTEDLIEKLNQTIYKQQQQIEFLYRELKAIKEQASSSGGGGSGASGTVNFSPSGGVSSLNLTSAGSVKYNFTPESNQTSVTISGGGGSGATGYGTVSWTFDDENFEYKGKLI